MTTMLDNIIDFLKVNPAVVTGLFVVVGVLLTNYASGERLTFQLREDRKRDENKRLFEGRRDVYLEAADAIATAITCIGRLADLNTSTYDIVKPFYDNVGSVAKVHLVASEQTSLRLIEIMKGIGLSITELTVARALAQESISKLDNNEERQKKEVIIRVEFADTCIFETVKIAPLLEAVTAELRSDLQTSNFVADVRLPFSAVAWVSLDNFRNAMEMFLAQKKLGKAMWKPDGPMRPTNVLPRRPPSP